MIIYKNSKFQKEYDEALGNPTFCACGCDQNITLSYRHRVRGVPKYISGHHRRQNVYNSRIRDGRLLYKESKNYFCNCPCFAKIEILDEYKWYGVPKYIIGHNRRGVVYPKEAKLKQSAKLTGRPSEKKGKKWEEICSTPEIAASSRLIKKEKALFRVPSFKPSSIELLLKEQLLKENIKFKFQYVVAVKKRQGWITVADFFIEPNLCIFTDGDFYHAYPGKYKFDNKIIGGKTAQQVWDHDFNINLELINNEYQILRFWEHEIHNNLEDCIKRIKEYVSCQKSV